MNSMQMNKGYIFDRRNLYEQIADCLKEMIMDEHMKENDKLPSEQKLAEKFSVSRNVIREALKTLNASGLIELRNGAGAYVKGPEASNLSDIISCMVSMENIRFEDIYEIRTILETAAAEKAASKINDEQIQNLKDILQKLGDRSITVKERRDYDLEFHIAIAEAAGNSLLVIFIHTMKNLFISMIEKGIFVEGGIEDACLRHRRIVDALEERNPLLSRQRMLEHIAASKENVDNFHKVAEKRSILEA